MASTKTINAGGYLKLENVGHHFVLNIVGRPGSGKTLLIRLLLMLGFRRLHLGDVMKTMKMERNVLKAIKTFQMSGKIVPDKLSCPIIEHGIRSQSSLGGLILDGATRTLAQADLVHGILMDKRVKMINVLIPTPQAECRKRILKNASNDRAGRPDDHPRVVNTRFREFDRHTVQAVKRLKRLAAQNKQDIMFVTIPWTHGPLEKLRFLAPLIGIFPDVETWAALEASLTDLSQTGKPAVVQTPQVPATRVLMPTLVTASPVAVALN